MKHRCYFISALCALSMYSWYNYGLSTGTNNNDNCEDNDKSINNNNNNNYFNSYYSNCLLMIFYLCWDAFHMLLSSNRRILFRTDLIIHHTVTLFTTLHFINCIPLQISNTIIMECISLLNYVWKDDKKKLNLYRTFCILLVRVPCSFFFIFYNRNNIVNFPYTKINGYWFFIFYDTFILWKLYKPKTLK